MIEVAADSAAWAWLVGAPGAAMVGFLVLLATARQPSRSEKAQQKIDTNEM